ncbi:Replicase polyprotein 1ab [Trachymyrmex septentrionalis]|uniref:Replicase polyprotein 1ab n=2 Tax=Trachymyrmex septentrionalis TaxID=34720 RepID=A0A195F2K0_9HYME|nr:PREDICTED: protein PFC0760c-like isoform X2 [Trachymyrmex septentrionalis]XP_018348771.1 PREDICTED: protein PFC0760c-like isoform X2 [Trachymyrmex septentrionalis]KYN34688.1 Replicase polyprotein 1ab [Trachymyrmex septentrionalis]
MRLSTIFELLLILLLVAFAAYGRVIDHNEATHRVARAANNVKQSDIDLSTMSLKQATDSVNRYCTCNENICNCCRDFHIPLVQLKGPGCASLQYLQGDNLAVQLSFGDNILTSTIVNGKNPKPVCVPLPGGFTKFCGRIYSIQRDAKNHFKACLGLELQSPTELEATLRVSCFRFGPDGLKLRPAEPLPTVETDAASEEDDDDDFFGLGSDDDDEDEDDERPITNSVPDGSEVDAQESDDDDDDDDPLGFSALLDIFTGDDDVPTKPKVTTAAPLLEFTIPILARPTTPASLEDHELLNNEQETNYEEHDGTQEPFKAEEEEEEEEDTGLTESNIEDSTDENNEQITESSNKIVYTAKPDKVPIVNKVKKGVVGNKKKPTVTSTSVNAILDPEKPAKKPIKDEDNDDDDILDDDDDDDDDEDLDDEDDSLEDDDEDDKDDEDEDEDEDEENDDKLDDNEKHEEHDDDEDEKAEDFADLDDDDDDDEEENAMLSALIDTGGKKKKSKENTKSNQTNVEHDDEDYGLELGFLARKRHYSGNRQSKVMRL